ncbi:MAG: response regulator [Bacteroidetes bacterium]|jgi:DNA-binding NtrC family response regulator|nr:response regulator [Bacteroidota bacterium]
MSKNTMIFIVDDDPMQLSMLKDHLSAMANFDINTFSTGEECLAQIGKAPDIVFLDYNLNSKNSNAMDGLDVLQEIKSKSPSSEVIMLSGQDKIEVAVDTMKYGAYDYIVKGESAFYRAEKAIFNLYRLTKLKRNAGMYRTLTIAFGAALLVMIILVIYLKSKGLISDRAGWM